MPESHLVTEPQQLFDMTTRIIVTAALYQNLCAQPTFHPGFKSVIIQKCNEIVPGFAGPYDKTSTDALTGNPVDSIKKVLDSIPRALTRRHTFNHKDIIMKEDGPEEIALIQLLPELLRFVDAVSFEPCDQRTVQYIMQVVSASLCQKLCTQPTFHAGFKAMILLKCDEILRGTASYQTRDETSSVIYDKTLDATNATLVSIPRSISVLGLKDESAEINAFIDLYSFLMTQYKDFQNIPVKAVELHKHRVEALKSTPPHHSNLSSNEETKSNSSSGYGTESDEDTPVTTHSSYSPTNKIVQETTMQALLRDYYEKRKIAATKIQAAARGMFARNRRWRTFVFSGDASKKLHGELLKRLQETPAEDGSESLSLENVVRSWDTSRCGIKANNLSFDGEYSKRYDFCFQELDDIKILSNSLHLTTLQQLKIKALTKRFFYDAKISAIFHDKLFHMATYYIVIVVFEYLQKSTISYSGEKLLLSGGGGAKVNVTSIPGDTHAIALSIRTLASVCPTGSEFGACAYPIEYNFSTILRADPEKEQIFKFSELKIAISTLWNRTISQINIEEMFEKITSQDIQEEETWVDIPLSSKKKREQEGIVNQTQLTSPYSPAKLAYEQLQHKKTTFDLKIVLNAKDQEALISTLCYLSLNELHDIKEDLFNLILSTNIGISKISSISYPDLEAPGATPLPAERPVPVEKPEEKRYLLSFIIPICLQLLYFACLHYRFKFSVLAPKVNTNFYFSKASEELYILKAISQLYLHAKTFKDIDQILDWLYSRIISKKEKLSILYTNIHQQQKLSIPCKSIDAVIEYVHNRSRSLKKREELKKLIPLLLSNSKDSLAKITELLSDPTIRQVTFGQSRAIQILLSLNKEVPRKETTRIDLFKNILTLYRYKKYSECAEDFRNTYLTFSPAGNADDLLPKVIEGLRSFLTAVFDENIAQPKECNDMFEEIVTNLDDSEFTGEKGYVLTTFHAAWTYLFETVFFEYMPFTNDAQTYILQFLTDRLNTDPIAPGDDEGTDFTLENVAADWFVKGNKRIVNNVDLDEFCKRKAVDRQIYRQSLQTPAIILQTAKTLIFQFFTEAKIPVDFQKELFHYASYYGPLSKINEYLSASLMLMSNKELSLCSQGGNTVEIRSIDQGQMSIYVTEPCSVAHSRTQAKADGTYHFSVELNYGTQGKLLANPRCHFSFDNEQIGGYDLATLFHGMLGKNNTAELLLPTSREPDTPPRSKQSNTATRNNATVRRSLFT